MAHRNGKPELEDGYSRIANETLEALARTSLTDYESRCVHFLWRKTYGWQNSTGQSKKEDVISHGQWARGTAMHRRHVPRTLDRLFQRNIISKSVRIRYGKKLITWSFQKYYHTWVGTFFEELPEHQPQLPPNEVAVSTTLASTAPQPGSTLPPNEVALEAKKHQPQLPPSEVGTKEYKDTSTKDLLHGEAAFLKILKVLPGWRFDLPEDVSWLREFYVDYPAVTVEYLKNCRDRFSGQPKPKDKGVWKNRLRNWMKKDAEFKKAGGDKKDGERQVTVRSDSHRGRAKAPTRARYLSSIGKEAESD